MLIISFLRFYQSVVHLDFAFFLNSFLHSLEQNDFLVFMVRFRYSRWLAWFMASKLVFDLAMLS